MRDQPLTDPKEPDRVADSSRESPQLWPWRRSGNVGGGILSSRGTVKGSDAVEDGQSRPPAAADQVDPRPPDDAGAVPRPGGRGGPPPSRRRRLPRRRRPTHWRPQRPPPPADDKPRPPALQARRPSRPSTSSTRRGTTRLAHARLLAMTALSLPECESCALIAARHRRHREAEAPRRWRADHAGTRCAPIPVSTKAYPSRETWSERRSSLIDASRRSPGRPRKTPPRDAVDPRATRRDAEDPEINR